MEAEADKGLLRVRVKNVTRPVEPPRKVEIKSSQSNKVIEGEAG